MAIAGTFPANVGIPSMVLYHFFIGIIEAVLTVIVLVALDKFRPDLLAWNQGDA
jgi:cobalt/nickel transport system permease protein